MTDQTSCERFSKNRMSSLLQKGQVSRTGPWLEDKVLLYKVARFRTLYVRVGLNFDYMQYDKTQHYEPCAYRRNYSP